MGRIFTVVGRDRTVMICDSKTGKGTYKVYNSTTIGSLYAIKNVLQQISNTPAHIREDRYAILIPDCVKGLHSADITNYWMQYRRSRRGTPLTMEFVGLIADIVNLQNEIGNVKILCGSRMYKGVYATQVRRAWKTLEQIKPKSNLSIYMAK